MLNTRKKHGHAYSCSYCKFSESNLSEGISPQYKPTRSKTCVCYPQIMCQWSVPLWNQRSRWETASLQPFAEWRVSCKVVCATVSHRPLVLPCTRKDGQEHSAWTWSDVMEPSLHDLCEHMQGPRALWQNCPRHVISQGLLLFLALWYFNDSFSFKLYPV